MRILPSIATLALASCATTQAAPPTPSWQAVATDNDRQRLRDWRTAFTRALDQARAAGHAADLEREGRLLEPDAAIAGVPIPNGDYRCRTIKLGAKNQGLLNYVAYPAFRCRIEQRRFQHFAKLTGSQRPVGRFYPSDTLRQVFLGTMVLGDESRAYQYGRDQDRDIAGWVERIGERHWRMVLPYPHYESILDVVELIPEQ
jgi:Domain of unknown function (DUF4893)